MVFRTWTQKTLEERIHAVSSVPDSCTFFLDSAANVHIVGYVIVEEDAP